MHQLRDRVLDWAIENLGKMDDSELKWCELEAPTKGINCPKCKRWIWLDQRWVSSTNHLMCVFGCGEIAKVSYHITEVLEVDD